ncbi:MAG: pilin [Patescibacteria group bacterium]
MFDLTHSSKSRFIPLFAAVDLGIFSVGNSINLSAADPRTVIVNFINLALQFVGILVLLMVLWGGFLYMVSGGNEEKTKRATAVIRNAFIGAVIILCAWGIVRFTLTSLLQATGQ